MNHSLIVLTYSFDLNFGTFYLLFDPFPGLLGFWGLESVSSFPWAVRAWDQCFLSLRLFLGHPWMYLAGRRN